MYLNLFGVITYFTKYYLPVLPQNAELLNQKRHAFLSSVSATTAATLIKKTQQQATVDKPIKQHQQP